MRREADARYLVTAHHADDQVETVLLRFLNGSGVAGFSGIAARSAEDVVRPLLPFKKRTLIAWAGSDRVMAKWLHRVHDDPSNYDAVHDRSWLRHAILPRFRERRGEEVDDAILRVAAHSRNDRAAWSAVLRALPDLAFNKRGSSVQVARSTLQRYDPRLSIALLCAAAREAGCILGPERARRLWPRISPAPSGRIFQLGKGWVIETTFDRLRIRRSSTVETPESESSSVAWGETPEGSASFGSWTVSWTPGVAETMTRDEMVTWVTPGPGVIRGPHAGDRVLPLGGVGRRKVSRLLMEGKVPRSERPDYPVLARRGQILWLPGICRTELEVPQPGEAALRLDAQFDRR